MKKLTQNAINILGENGKKWLSNLPNIVKILTEHWKLNNLIPVDNMSYHYVAKATTDNNSPVVLKIGFDEKSIADEKQALIYFNGNASVQLIDDNNEYHALLLQQAIPGTTLKSLYPGQENFVIDCYVDTVKKLLDKVLHDKNNFRHISEWLKVIDTTTSSQLPEHLLKKSIHLKSALLSSMKTEVFLHGDLHHDNIIKNDNQWLAIDPKGIVGDPEFEVAAFDFIHETELKNNSPIKELFLSRINIIAKKSNLNAQRIKDWVFIRLVLSAIWSIEDNNDPSWAINLADIII